jgi:hypothetical protein
MERLRKEGNDLVYRCAKHRSDPTSDKRGAKADELTLTPLELIDRIAALVVVSAEPGRWGCKSSVSRGLKPIPRCDTFKACSLRWRE